MCIYTCEIQFEHYMYVWHAYETYIYIYIHKYGLLVVKDAYLWVSTAMYCEPLAGLLLVTAKLELWKGEAKLLSHGTHCWVVLDDNGPFYYISRFVGLIFEWFYYISRFEQFPVSCYCLFVFLVKLKSYRLIYYGLKRCKRIIESQFFLEKWWNKQYHQPIASLKKAPEKSTPKGLEACPKQRGGPFLAAVTGGVKWEGWFSIARKLQYITYDPSCRWVVVYIYSYIQKAGRATNAKSNRNSAHSPQSCSDVMTKGFGCKSTEFLFFFFIFPGCLET